MGGSQLLECFVSHFPENQEENMASYVESSFIISIIINLVQCHTDIWINSIFIMLTV